MLAESPGGVKKLRKMILQLAVQGKLTKDWRKENPNVEPASVLLEKIRKGKEELIKEGKIKKRKPLPVTTVEEKPFELPEGWDWVRLELLGQTQTGTTPPTKNPENYGSFLPFIGPGDILDGNIRYNNNALSKTGAEIGRLIPAKSILMVCIGGSIGKCAMNQIDVSCNQQINTITPARNINSSYIYRTLKSKYFFNMVLSHSTGSATPIINRQKWSNIPVPVPPIKEQQEIVAKVDTLMSLCDEIEKQQQKKVRRKRSLNKASLFALNTSEDKQRFKKNWNDITRNFDLLYSTPENVNDLKQAIFQLGIQGKLTEKWRKENPNIEPASVLLEKIQDEKEKLIKEGKIKKQKPLPEISEEEKPFELPEGWDWVRLGSVHEFLNGFAFKSHTYVKHSSNQVVRLGNVKNTGLDVTRSPVFIPSQIAENAQQYKLRTNDILITMTGTRNKRDFCYTALLKEFDFSDCSLFLNQRVGCLRFYERLDVNFINTFLKSNTLLDHLFSTATGTANQANISTEQIKLLPFPIAPYEEQLTINRKLQLLDLQCDTIINQIGAKDNKSVSIFNALLDGALRF